MFNSANLYELFKPENLPDLITSYEVVIGGTALPANLEKGVIVLTPLNSQPFSSHDNHYQKPFFGDNENQPELKIPETSILQTRYQCDIYKVNSKNAEIIEAEAECYKVREWLMSMECAEYLDGLGAEILPLYEGISFSVEYTSNKKLVNRASFDFFIISTNEIQERVNEIAIFNINSTILTGGHDGISVAD